MAKRGIFWQVGEDEDSGVQSLTAGKVTGIDRKKSLENTGKDVKKAGRGNYRLSEAPPGFEPGMADLQSGAGSRNILKNKVFSDSLNPSGTAKGTKLTEPLVPIETKELLIELTNESEGELLSYLPSELRFVVQYWPALSESDQWVILAIVRRVLDKSQGSN